jgi:hypothetical protein
LEIANVRPSARQVAISLDRVRAFSFHFCACAALAGPIVWVRSAAACRARDVSFDLSNTCRIYGNALIFANAFAIWPIAIHTGAHRSAQSTPKHTPPVT